MNKVRALLFGYLMIFHSLNLSALDLTSGSYHVGLAITQAVNLVPDLIKLKAKVENIKKNSLPCMKNPNKNKSEKLKCTQQIISVLEELSPIIGKLISQPCKADPSKTTPGIIAILVRGFANEADAKKVAAAGLTLLEVIKILNEVNLLLGSLAESEKHQELMQAQIMEKDLNIESEL